MGNPGLVKYRTPLICLALAVATFIAFEQVRNYDFVSYDDDPYITDNPNVNKGLSLKSVIWAFKSGHMSNWHPVTWLSHMLDCQLFGVNPGRHHLVNVLFHIANTLLLFGILKNMTGTLWRSAFVAAAFAVHPLHVESVAWIAERKDVLSTLFWMLTILAYYYYAKRSGIARYLLVVILFALGLMAKPMLVTLPFVLLLLDYWPLNRLQLRVQNGAKISIPYHLIIEKVPLFILAAGSSVITFLVQQKGGSVAQIENVPLKLRTCNALVSYVGYICKMIYPRGLAVLYPLRPHGAVLWLSIVSFIILAVVSVCVLFAFRKRRYLIVGWLWYLGTLIPVIGLVQVGMQAMADRYSYLPLIGIFIMIAWGIHELLAKWRYRKVIPAVLAGIVLIGFLLCTRIQVRHWQNSLTLYKHALAVTENNYVIHCNYGSYLNEGGRHEEAIEHCQKALQLKPDYADAHNNFGVMMIQNGKLEDAIEHFQKALQLKPDYADAHNNLGNALGSLGKHEQAIEHFQQVLKLKPDYADAHYNLAVVLLRQNKVAEGIAYWKEALRLKPDWSQSHNDLAWFLVTVKDKNLREPAEAIRHAKRACELTQYSNPHFLDTLSVACAVAGDFQMAIEIADKALQLAVGNEKLTNKIQKHIELYKANKPYSN